MLNVGGPELLIILLVALVFLGPQRLPELARQMGQAVASLRSLASGFQAELEAASRPDPDPSMSLKGPTKQSDAVAQTQTAETTADAGLKPQSDRGTGDRGVSDPVPEATKGTDPASVAKAARQVNYDDDDRAVSAGGPQDLSHASDNGIAPDVGAETDAAPDAGAAPNGGAPNGGATETDAAQVSDSPEDTA